MQMIERNQAKYIDIHSHNILIRQVLLFEALKSNKSLVGLHLDYTNHVDKRRKLKSLVPVLQGPNTTLQSATFQAQYEYRKGISYYTNLNKYGRGKVRDPETTIPELVNLLEAVPEYKMLYGLLRDSPGNWCFKVLSSTGGAAAPNTTASYKRSHSQI
jgi:hypothetical protein